METHPLIIITAISFVMTVIAIYWYKKL